MLNEINLSRIDLNLLTLFETVLQQGHVGRAAAYLNLSPSAVSHGLGRLRKLLNDPLFLRTPKGVVPTERALRLAEPITDILARARSVIAGAEPFDPARSSRRFTIGAPDGIAAVLLPSLLEALESHAPGIDLGIKQLLPGRTRTFRGAWGAAFDEIEAGAIDLAIAPIDDVPTRFAARALYEEDFVVVMRASHPFAAQPTLERFCQMRHLLISLAGDPFGFVDEELAKLGRTRRVALTLPDWTTGLATLAASDLIAAMPRRFVAMHAPRFGLASREAPLPLPRFTINAVVAKAALMDAGVAWLFDVVSKTAAAHGQSPPPRPRGGNGATGNSADRRRPRA